MKRRSSVAGLTLLALVAFAANSVLSRLALGGALIDAGSFTGIRLLSGAIAMTLLSLSTNRGSIRTEGSWGSGLFLFLYAGAFSFAYLSLGTGVGALILFGAVQATMILSAVLKGERPTVVEWTGVIVAMGGLTYLVLPGLEAPPIAGASLMLLSGIAWGFYSLRGKSASSPVARTAGNFLRSLPPALLLWVLVNDGIHISVNGLLFATISGAVTSGIGYAIWYAALEGLTATRASVVQLSVPVLAAAGGVIFLSEEITGRLLISGILILGGVGLAITGKWKSQK